VGRAAHPRPGAAPRAVPIVEAMAAMVVMDNLAMAGHRFAAND